MRQGCILSPHLFNLYSESVIREVEIEELGIDIGGKLVSNMRYTDDMVEPMTHRFVQSHGKVGKARLRCFY